MFVLSKLYYFCTGALTIILKTLSNHFFIYLLYNPNYGDMVTLFHKCMHIFWYIVSCTNVIFYYHNKSQQLFLGSGGKWLADMTPICIHAYNGVSS